MYTNNSTQNNMKADTIIKRANTTVYNKPEDEPKCKNPNGYSRSGFAKVNHYYPQVCSPAHNKGQ